MTRHTNNFAFRDVIRHPTTNVINFLKPWYVPNVDELVYETEVGNAALLA